MTTDRRPPNVCDCGRETQSARHKICDLCRRADKHRHRTRRKDEIIVKVDGEGRPQENGLMGRFSWSYGREDGSSGSIQSDDPRKILRWLVDELSGEYEGKKQAVGSFHFTWDASILCREGGHPLDIDPADLELIHKAGAKETGLLCRKYSCTCTKLHAYDTDTIRDVISDGGEGDIIAWDQKSGLAFAMSHKRRFYIEHRPNGDRYEDWRRVDIHDNGTAFTGDLLTVIDKWKPELSAEQQAIINWGKTARKHGFLGASDERIMAYSEAECVADAKCTRILLEMLKAEAKLPMRASQLFGSGSVADAAFRFHGVPRREDTQTEHEDLARLNYYGGLIEAIVVGLVKGEVSEDDLNSAYPSKMIHMPCMREGHGRWEHKKGDKRALPTYATVGHVKASWHVKTPTTPPFIVRTTAGSVRAPLSGFGLWVTLPEFQQALKQFPGEVSCHEAYWWVQTCKCGNPLAWLKDIYAQRLRIKNEMQAVSRETDEWQSLNVRQEALKLVINSCYGKLAQTRPAYGVYTNLHWAGYITGATRATVRAETWRQEALGATPVYQHTDSVLYVGGKPNIEDETLGAWGHCKPSSDLVIFAPGLATAVGGGKTASRGIRKSVFQDAAGTASTWMQTNDLGQHPTTWTRVEITQQRMIGRRTAMARNKPELAGTFLDEPMKIGPTDGKRDLKAAYPMPGQDTAWIVPPIEYVADPASLDDLKIYQTRLAKRIQAGEWDS